MRINHKYKVLYYNIKSFTNFFALQFSLIMIILNFSSHVMKAHAEKEESICREEQSETSSNWQSPTWPNFSYDLSKIQDALNSYQEEVAILSEKFNRLSRARQREVVRELMALEGIKMLGLDEDVDYDEMLSFLENEVRDNALKKYRSIGIAQLMFLINKTFQERLSKEQLFKYHNTVLTDPAQRKHLNIAQWRTRDVVVRLKETSGKLKIFYRPLPSEKVTQEMTRFIDWFNKTDPVNGTLKIPGPVRAAIAYLYFESVHPFADANGRIGRALVKKALLQELRWPLFSPHIRVEAIEKILDVTTQQQNADITPWITSFVNLVYQDLLESKQQVLLILEKAETLDQL